MIQSVMEIYQRVLLRSGSWTASLSQPHSSHVYAQTFAFGHEASAREGLFKREDELVLTLKQIPPAEGRVIDASGAGGFC